MAKSRDTWRVTDFESELIVLKRSPAGALHGLAAGCCLVLFSLPWLVNPLLSLSGPVIGVMGWFWALLGLAAGALYWAFFPDRVAFSKLVAISLLLAALLSAGIGFIQFAGHAADWRCCIAASASGEVYGNLKQRNQLASLMSLALVALVFHVNSARVQKGWVAAVYIAAAALAVSLALTASRIGALQWICLAGLCFLWRKNWSRAAIGLMIWALIAYVLAVLATPSLAQATSNANIGLIARIDVSPGENSGHSRLTLWGNVLELIAAKPWGGWGWGELAWAHYSSVFKGQRFVELVDNAHNLPLHIAVELGLPVAALFCAVVMGLIYVGKPWAEHHPAQQLAWGAWLVIGLHSLVEYPLWYGPFMLIMGLTGLILCMKPLRMHVKLAGAALKFIAIIFTLAAAWLLADYHLVRQIYLAPEQRNAQAHDPLAWALRSRLFKGQAQFAQLMLLDLKRENAQELLDLAQKVLHFSPEPRVIEKLIEAAVMLHRDDLAGFHLQRYRAAYPQAFEAWRAHNRN